MLRLLRHYFYFVPAQLSKAKGIGKNILLKFNQPVFFHPGELRRQCAPVLLLTIMLFSPHHNPGLAEE